MVRKRLVLVDPHLTYSATTVTADWNYLPKEVVMIINNFIRKMDYDDHWGWGESIARVGEIGEWGRNTDMVKAFLIYRHQMTTDIVKTNALREQLLADIIGVDFDRAYAHAVASGYIEIQPALDMV